MQSSARFLSVSFLALKLGVAGALAIGCAAGHGNDNNTAEEAPVEADEAVVRGAGDHGRHPAVVALVATDASGTTLCSGALVAPDVVLTARHCVVELASESLACPKHDVKISGKRDPASITVFVGDDVKTGRQVANGAEILTPSGKGLCDHDIALLKLDRAVEGIQPLDIGVDDPVTTDQSIVAVGFGLDAEGADASAGIKRFRQGISIVDATDTEFTIGEGTCSGDSGGPAIDPESGHIIGVVSRGTAPCNSGSAQNVYTRVAPWKSLFKKAIENLDPDNDGDTAGKSPDGADDGSADAGGSKRTGRGGGKGSGKGGGKKGTPTDMGSPCTKAAECSGGVCVKVKGGGGYCSKKCGKHVGKCGHGYSCKKSKSGGSVCVEKKKKTSELTSTESDDEASGDGGDAG